MTECYFTPIKETTSATICANCGKEKMLHTIGENIKANKVVIITDSPRTTLIPSSITITERQN